jgi:hypothetical protein
MQHYCSSCSLALCELCVVRHQGKDECKLFSMAQLHEAWLAMKQRVASQNLECIALIPAGTLVNAPQEVRRTEVSQYIASIFMVLGDFEFGKTYLRQKYLHPLRQKAKVAPTQPAVGYVTDERQAPATKILRKWAIAATPAVRAAACKEAVFFLTGQVRWR